MKKLFPFLFIVAILFNACGPDAAEQKKREQEIADSVARMLTGKPLSDSTNIDKMERVKADSNSAAKEGTIKADAKGLKKIIVEYDYDNKLFNKKSDIDGKIFNNSSTSTFKNIQLKVVCKDKNGNVVKSFIHTEYITLSPGGSHKIRIKFTDAEKTKEANVSVVDAEEVL